VGTYDIIFCGRVAGDWDAGQVGSGIAEVLGIPSITLAKKIDIGDGKVRVERLVADGFEIIEAPMPCLITVTSELGEPRYAPLKGIMKAAKIQPVIWKPQDIGVEPSQIGAQGRRAKLVKLFQPVKEGKCEIIEGENVADAAVNLAVRLREAKVL
jgi:electron transfer flavoprotein beta subunit